MTDQLLTAAAQTAGRPQRGAALLLRHIAALAHDERPSAAARLRQAAGPALADRLYAALTPQP